jgi:hypothetical protein
MKLGFAALIIAGVLGAIGSTVELARADNCVAQCRAAHNQCRIAAKAVSAPQCDAQLQACIERCGKGR